MLTDFVNLLSEILSNIIGLFFVGLAMKEMFYFWFFFLLLLGGGGFLTIDVTKVTCVNEICQVVCSMYVFGNSRQDWKLRVREKLKILFLCSVLLFAWPRMPPNWKKVCFKTCN